MEQYFEKALELAEKPEPIPGSEAQGPRPAWQRILFKGQLNSVVWWGHMYLLAHQGLGYWVYVAAPTQGEAETLGRDVFSDNGRGFVLTTTRQGWREQPTKMQSFTSADGTLTVAAPEGIFQAHTANEQDEHGILHLFAKYQKDANNRKNADVMVLALPKQPGGRTALEGAKKYLEDKKREESADYTINSAGEKADGAAQPVGNKQGMIAECQLMRGTTPARFWIVAVIDGADKTYVVRCDATWESRQIWRGGFSEFVGFD